MGQPTLHGAPSAPRVLLSAYPMQDKVGEVDGSVDKPAADSNDVFYH